jgi:hypothetical protein
MKYPVWDLAENWDTIKINLPWNRILRCEVHYVNWGQEQLAEFCGGLDVILSASEGSFRASSESIIRSKRPYTVKAVSYVISHLTLL